MWVDDGRGIRCAHLLARWVAYWCRARTARAHSPIPPYATGSNIDTRRVTASPTLAYPSRFPARPLLSACVCISSLKCRIQV